MWEGSLVMLSRRTWAKILAKEVSLIIWCLPLLPSKLHQSLWSLQKMSSIYSQVTRKINPFSAARKDEIFKNILLQHFHRIRMKVFANSSLFQDGHNRSHAMKENVNGKQLENADPTYPLLPSPKCFGDRHGINSRAKRWLNQLFTKMSKLVRHSYWEGLRPKITPQPKPYSDRTAIKFTSKVDFNLLSSPFRYLDIANDCAGHDSHWLSSHLWANKWFSRKVLRKKSAIFCHMPKPL